MTTIILVALGALIIMFGFAFINDLIKNKADLGEGNFGVSLGIGAVTDFLDTLGIGSFAPTTLLFKVFKVLKTDKLIPGTLNVSHTIPVMLEAFLFIKIVEVAPLTLFSLVIAASLGSLIGSKIISKMPEKKIQLVMGVALVVTAILMALKQLGVLAALGAGNTATALTGGKLVIGIIGNFIFGALMTAGVGLYAPCMAMVNMLGLSPKVSFPIMMASCAALMPVASFEFIKTGQYSRKVSLGITLGGIVGVLIAVPLVDGMNMDILTWVIVAVVTYTGVSMFLKSIKKDDVAVS